MKHITVLITEDHALVLQSFSMMFSSDPRFTIVAECTTGEDAVEKARSIQPDIVLMDINLPGINGIEATRQITQSCPSTKVLCVTMHATPNFTRVVMQAGASGYVTKSSSMDELLEAVITIHDGKKYVCREIKDLLSVREFDGTTGPIGLEQLTKRERTIINLLKTGLSSREISEQLDISSKTVEVHRSHILKKLKLSNVAALINYINKEEAPGKL